ncbi:major facilitator superfamily, putative [Plasmodium ovale wallikeri]|uniref:Major facilitator superfamily, putative n=1 Tax=Plasmodium ovale wallikeri TaxID=864142 RepID=A0A1A8ZIW4_PLAOA|nr:major facilitator superfamily, putative [Plasmodium ovale wallikeri]
MILQKDKENLFYDNDEYEKVKKKTLFKILLTVFIKTLFESFLQPLLPFYILNYYHIEVKELGILLRLIVSLLIVLTISSELLSQNQNKLQKKIIKNSHIHTYQNEYISNSNNYTRSDVNNNMNKCTHNNSNNNNSNNNNNNNSNNNNGNNNNNNSNNNNGNNGNNLTWSEFNKNNHVNRKNKHTTSSYKKGESSINSYLFNKKTSYSEAPYKGKMFNSHHDEFSDISYQQFLKRKKKKKFILLFVHYIKERLSLLLNRILTYKFKCLLAICLFRFSSAFSANLMSNIFFVFYNDNVSSDNKQIQISVFVSLSGIIMIFYQYFSFSYILEKFGYNGMKRRLSYDRRPTTDDRRQTTNDKRPPLCEQQL